MLDALHGVHLLGADGDALDVRRRQRERHVEEVYQFDLSYDDECRQ